MKILFLSDNFPPESIGGAEIAAFRLAKALLARGHELFVITATEDKAKEGEGLEDGIKVFRIYSRYPGYLVNYFAIYNPQTVSKVRQILEKLKPDIVHAQNIHSQISFYALKLARRFARGVFITAHDTMLFSCGKFDDFLDPNDPSVRMDFNYRTSFFKQLKTARKRFNPFRNLVIRHYLRYADKIFSITGVLKKALADNGIHNVATVHYGVDTDEVALPGEINKFKEKYNIFG